MPQPGNVEKPFYGGPETPDKATGELKIRRAVAAVRPDGHHDGQVRQIRPEVLHDHRGDHVLDRGY